MKLNVSRYILLACIMLCANWDCLAQDTGLHTELESELEIYALTQSNDFFPGAKKRSAGAAVILEWLVPTAGHLYAGNWKKGVLPAATRMGGILIFATNLYSENTELQAVGLIMGVGGTVWSLASAGRTARAFNGKHSFKLVVQRSGVGAGIKLNF